MSEKDVEQKQQKQPSKKQPSKKKGVASCMVAQLGNEMNGDIRQLGEQLQQRISQPQDNLKVENPNPKPIKEATTDEIINEELASMIIIDIPIDQLYSAPSQWNEWHRLPENKILELAESIIKIGQQSPCILWKIDKSKVENYYSLDEFKVDPYGFQGNQYMILSGHNRAFSRKLISELSEYQTNQTYKTVPAVVYDSDFNETFIEKAQDIINDTNYLSRENTKKEIMNAIRRKYIKASQRGRKKSGEIAQQIATELKLTNRTIYNYTKLEDNLLPEVLELILDEKISFRNGLSLADLAFDIQQHLVNEYFEVLLDKNRLTKLLKNIQPTMLWEEVLDHIEDPEKKMNLTSVKVTVPTEFLDDFYSMVKEWKTQKKSESKI